MGRTEADLVEMEVDDLDLHTLVAIVICFRKII